MSPVPKIMIGGQEEKRREQGNIEELKLYCLKKICMELDWEINPTKIKKIDYSKFFALLTI